MSGVQIKKVLSDEDGMRLDRWFRQHFPQIRHGMLEKFLRKGQVRVDGGRVKANARLVSGQDVRIPPIDHISTSKEGEKGPSNSQSRSDGKTLARDRALIEDMTIFEDDHLLVLNKPHGLAVQGGTNTKHHIDAMMESVIKDGVRPRLVHRLDRDTSGVLVLAKTRKAATRLGEFFQKHQVEKTYWALTAGIAHPREGTINMPIAKRMVTIKDNEQQERMIPVEGEDAKKAITDFQTIDDAGAGVAFIALRPRTGRTHQLRVHCTAIGIPIIGDGKYGKAGAKLDGISSKLHLFCRSMSFRHPHSGAMVNFTAQPSGHFKESLKFFAFNQNANVEWPDII